MAKQISLQGPGLNKPNDAFGGALLRGNHPKTKRPLESKLPLHLVLRAKKSFMRLPTTFAKVNELVIEVSRKHNVRIYQYANVGNHLHLLIKIPGRTRWAAFIRELTGRIALLTKRLLKCTGDFWLHRPFTRVVRGWRQAYRVAKEYVHLNWLEAEGLISSRETKTLKKLRAIFADPLDVHRRSD